MNLAPQTMRADFHRPRSEPRLSDAVSATGAVAVAFGILLIAIDIYADHPGRTWPIVLFAAFTLIGYGTLYVLPRVLHPAGITAMVIGIPAALGWWLLPGAHRFADIRPYIILTIVAMLLCTVVPRSRGRAIFVAVALSFLLFWANGEVAGTDAFSASPLPSPPAHTTFSLSLLNHRSDVTIDDLDPTSRFYALAQSCDAGLMFACDTLYRTAPAGSDFRSFGATCGDTNPDAVPGECGLSEDDTGDGSTITPLTPPSFDFGNGNDDFGNGSDGFGNFPTDPSQRVHAVDDKSVEIGLTSLFIGLAYLGMLLALDRHRNQAIATAFVVPGFLGLVIGAEALGNATHHSWLTGLFTLLAGLLFGTIGHLGQRRFSTWAGGLMVAIGAVTVALDSAHIQRSVRDENVKLAGPGLIVVAFGAALVVLAWIVARVLARVTTPPEKLET